MVGDIRGILAVGPVHIALVFRAFIGVGQAGEGHLLVVVNPFEGRVQDGRELVEILVVLREVKGEFDGGLGNDGVLSVSALPGNLVRYQPVDFLGGDDRFQARTAFDVDRRSGPAGKGLGLIGRDVEHILLGLRVGAVERIYVL